MTYLSILSESSDEKNSAELSFTQASKAPSII